MADPITAAGLASSIITFLDFAVKLAKLTKEVHDAQGELPKDLQKCQATVDEFSEWIRNLQTKLPRASSSPTKADEALAKVIDHCVEDCDALLKILQGLLPSTPAQGKTSTGQTFKTAIRAYRKNGAIQKAQSLLETHKNELRLCIAERTMCLAEENRDMGIAQLDATQTLRKLQQDGQQQNITMGQEILDSHGEQRHEARQMYTDLAHLLGAGNQETKRIGTDLQQLQVASKEEIVASIVQHNQKFDQISSSLNLMELDLDSIKTQGDDTLLLVKQLASAVDQRADGSAMICIRVPRALYDPSLSIWKDFRAYTEKVKAMSLPGGWVDERFQIQDRQVGNLIRDDPRVSYLAVSDATSDPEQLSWTRNVIGGDWSTRNFEAAYDRNQSWLSYFFCYETVAVRAIPLIRDTDRKEDDSEEDEYKTWKGITSRLRLTDADSKTTPDGDMHRKREAAVKEAAMSLEESKPQLILDNKPPSNEVEPAPEVGIRRRESLPQDLTVEESDLSEWIKSMEGDAQRQQRGQLQPVLAINQELLRMSTVSENSETVRHNIQRILKHFEERASFEMPELIQMMTTRAGSIADQAGQFRWGFQLIVARNEVHFQLVLFSIAIVAVWIFDPLSSSPVQSINGFFFRLLCAQASQAPLSPFMLFILRWTFSTLAIKSWKHCPKVAISVARTLAKTNPPWEAMMRKKIASRPKATRMSFGLGGTVTVLTLVSCSQRAGTFVGPWLAHYLSLAWSTFFVLTVISSLNYAKDWFKLHPNPSLQVYKLGAFLSMVVFTCAVASTVQQGKP